MKNTTTDCLSLESVTARCKRIQFRSSLARIACWCIILGLAGAALWGQRGSFLARPISCLFSAATGVVITWLIFDRYKRRLYADPYFQPLRVGSTEEVKDEPNLGYIEVRKVMWRVAIHGIQIPMILVSAVVINVPYWMGCSIGFSTMAASYFLAAIFLSLAQDIKTPSFVIVE